MAMLLMFFSTIIYTYINYTVDKRMDEQLFEHANYLFATYPNLEKSLASQKEILRQTLNIDANIITTNDKAKIDTSVIKTKNMYNQYFIEIHIPYQIDRDTKTKKYLSVKTNVTESKELQSGVYKNILIVNIIGMAIIIIYAYFLSSMLLSPINTIKMKLSNMDEHMLKNIDLSSLPNEFYPVAKAINSLTGRIRNYIKYQKELFIGSAHELKTPLAVMKTKNQVTMLKKDLSTQDLKDAIKQNIISIDEMNKAVSSILNFGRQEGAHLEEPQNIDVIEFLKNKMEGFKLLAESQKKNFKCDIKPKNLNLNIQPLLLNQIIQNFLQNSFKFTPKNHNIWFNTKLKKDNFIIEVIDEGIGINEEKDLFAPFVRSKESSGVGLGLFLAKSAAEALDANITLKNRNDAKGTIATLILHIK
jgi:two-component system, OmpR family, sensor kinase